MSDCKDEACKTCGHREECPGPSHTTLGGEAFLDKAAEFLQQGKIVVIYPEFVVMVGSARMLSEALMRRAILEELPTSGVPVQ